MADEPVTVPPPAPEEGWKVDKRGKKFIPRGDTNYPFYAKEGETIEETRARLETVLAGKGKTGDKRPKAKTSTKLPPKAEAPRTVDLKELERELAEVFRAPAIPLAMYGDEWGANHFTKSGPYLARNLVAAAEHNPWLKKKLEAMASGDAAVMSILSLMPVVSASLLYVVPPIIYFANLPVPNSTRERFGIPPRREPEYAAEPEIPPTPLFPDGTPRTPAA